MTALETIKLRVSERPWPRTEKITITTTANGYVVALETSHKGSGAYNLYVSVVVEDRQEVVKIVDWAVGLRGP